MNKLMVALIVLLLLGILGGAYWTKKKYSAAQRQVRTLNKELRRAAESVEQLTDLLASQSSARAVFLHHSVGRNILYAGGLQRLMLDRGIMVSGATYGDEIGQKTDVLDWAPKFESRMDDILTYKSHPDRYFSGGRRNDIVMFKSCYPNSNIIDPAAVETGAGDAARTVENYQAVFTRLKQQMLTRPETLFIYLTAPPLVPPKTTPENAARARRFNDWLINEFLPGYVAESERENFAVFDLFGFLAGQDNMLKPEYRREKSTDSHPSDEASRQAAEAFVAFIEPVWECWQGADEGVEG